MKMPHFQFDLNNCNTVYRYKLISVKLLNKKTVVKDINMLQMNYIFYSIDCKGIFRAEERVIKIGYHGGGTYSRRKVQKSGIMQK